MASPFGESREVREKMNIMTLKNVKAFYVLEYWGEKRTIRAVNGVSLEVPEGEIFGIAGESGCGKSTLLKVLLSSIEPPLRLVEGKILYRVNGEERDVSSFREGELRRLRWSFVSYIPQGSMHVLNPVKRVRDTFLEVLESHLKGEERRKWLSLAVEHLKELGLPPEVLTAFPHQLSGGMRQRVTIALATVLRPRVILADEPTTALDVVAQRAVLQLLKRIHREQGCTIVLVTHDMGIHAQLTTRMAIMYAGKIVEEGPTWEVFKSPLHPYTRHLIQSLPRIGDKSPRRGIPGNPPSLVSLPPGCAFHPRCPHASSRCAEEEPPLVEVREGHRVSCWLVRV